MGSVQEIHFRCQSTHSLGAVEPPPTDTKIGKPQKSKEDAEQVDDTDLHNCDRSQNVGHKVSHPAEQVLNTDDFSRGNNKPQDRSSGEEDTDGYSRGHDIEPHNPDGGRDLSRGHDIEPRDQTARRRRSTDKFCRRHAKRPRDLADEACSCTTRVVQALTESRRS